MLFRRSFAHAALYVPAAGGGAAYNANAVTFGGINEFLVHNVDLTGNADSKVGLFSVFFKLASGSDGARMVLAHKHGGRVLIERAVSNIITFSAANAANTTILAMETASTYTVDGLWHHLAAAWDLATGVAQIRIDGADDRAAAPTVTDDTIDYTRNSHSVGALVTGAFPWDGDMADYYLNTAETLDISVSANLEKFRSAAGKPVDLGSDGSTPTGTAPIQFFSGTTADWHTNKGTGGGFIENGTLTTASTSPSD